MKNRLDFQVKLQAFIFEVIRWIWRIVQKVTKVSIFCFSTEVGEVDDIWKIYNLHFINEKFIHCYYLKLIISYLDFTILFTFSIFSCTFLIAFFFNTRWMQPHFCIFNNPAVMETTKKAAQDLVLCKNLLFNSFWRKL